MPFIPFIILQFIIFNKQLLVFGSIMFHCEITSHSHEKCFRYLDKLNCSYLNALIAKAKFRQVAIHFQIEFKISDEIRMKFVALYTATLK